jgi:sulfonate transport system substrate-binding protein
MLTGLLGATLVAGSLAIGAADAAEARKEFRVGYQKGAAILAIAKQQQVFEKKLKELGVEKVEWVEFQFGPPLLEALGAGAVDIGSVGDSPPIFAQAAGADLVYISGSSTVASGVVVPKDSPIRSIAELKGKKVAIAKGSSSHNLTVQALRKFGLDFPDIEPVYLAPADAVAAFTTGQVDAWTIWDPYFAIAETRHGARSIATTNDEGLGGYSYYLANRTLANEHPELIVAVLEGLQEVSDWANANKDKVAAIHSEVTGVDIDSLNHAYARYEIKQLPFDDTLIASQQKIADTFFELGLIPAKINVRDIAWTAPTN